MPSWLCKIWNLLANIIGKILDIVFGAVKQFLDLAVEALDKLASALGFSGSGLLWLLGAGALAYFVLTKDDEQPPPQQGGNGYAAKPRS